MQYVASHLKDKNREKIFQYILANRETSRAMISRDTGISVPTVMKTVDFFIAKGLLRETGAGEAPMGRKPKLLRLANDAYYALGIDVQDDSIIIGICDIELNLIQTHRIAISRDLVKLIEEEIPRGIEQLLDMSGLDPKRIAGVGIGLPGTVDVKQNAIYYAYAFNLKYWDFSEVLNTLKEKFGFAFYLENDINAAAWGEYVARKRVPEDMIYVSIVTGLGAGLILGGKLRRGAHYFAGEIDFSIFERSYNAKEQGLQGWLYNDNDILSILEALKRLRRAAGEEKSGLEKTVERKLDKLASNVAMCIANLSVSIDIRLLVLGGMLFRMEEEFLMARIKEYLSRYLMFEIECEREKCNEPGVIGLCGIVFENEMRFILGD